MSTVDDAARQLVTMQIGDVTVVLNLPAGCPVPDVNLYVHAVYTTAAERAAALFAFDAGNAGIQLCDPTATNCWWNVDTDGCCATVFLADEDVTSETRARLLAERERDLGPAEVAA